jgi:uncharacterized UBP type Zn finger protein
MAENDEHLSQINSAFLKENLKAGRPKGCEDCLREGTSWVKLRRCLTCGHVGCCDSSPAKHATKHYKTTSHPIMQSAEPAEDWKWCYVDETYL